MAYGPSLVALFLVLIGLFNPSTALAQGHGVLNGGGAGEYSVVFASHNLHELLTDCRDLSCNPTAAERGILSLLLQTTQPTAIFKTKKELGSELFRITLGNEVWINQDELWLDRDHSEPFDLAAGVALWIDVLALELQADPLISSTLSEKARAAFAREFLRGRTDASGGQTFEYLVWQKAGLSDAFVIRDPSLTTIDLIPGIEHDLACAAPTVKFFAPAWDLGPRDPLAPSEVLFFLQFGVKWTCPALGSQAATDGNSTGQVSINTRRGADGTYAFDPSSLFIHIER
jgi:hypothetical protein